MAVHTHRHSLFAHYRRHGRRQCTRVYRRGDRSQAPDTVQPADCVLGRRRPARRSPRHAIRRHQRDLR